MSMRLLEASIREMILGWVLWFPSYPNSNLNFPRVKHSKDLADSDGPNYVLCVRRVVVPISKLKNHVVEAKS